jgi:deoxyadenosine/deoxycytidine kinase
MKGFNLLELFYQEPKKYNFLFQHYVQLTRLMDTIKSSESHIPKIRIMERSLQNNRYCFLELARKCEQLQSAEFAVLAEWHSWLETNMDLHLDLVIYLRTAPEVAYQRMTNRARAEESTCPLSYLAALHESYEDWLIRDKVGPEKRRRQQVIVVDANQSREDVAADCIQQLTRFLSSHSKSANGDHEASPTACADICRE